MTPAAGRGPAAAKARSRRRLSLALGSAALATLVGLALFSPRPVREAPRIVVSLDRTLFHRLGISRWTYLAAIRRAGGWPVRLDSGDPATAEADRDAVRQLIAGAHALVLSGGGDVDPELYGGERESALDLDPRRDRFETALMEEALGRGMPVLGVCRGSQLLNVVHGGTLRDLRADRELTRRHGRFRRHPVKLAAESRMAEIYGTTTLGGVVSYHGQAVDRLGAGLAAVGWADDGIVEAIEPAGEASPFGSWVAGVQWHPELAPRSRDQRRLFAALIEAAREFQAAEGPRG